MSDFADLVKRLQEPERPLNADRWEAANAITALVKELAIEKGTADRALKERDEADEKAFAFKEEGDRWKREFTAELSSRASAEAQVARLKEALSELEKRSGSFWSYLRGEHGVSLSSAGHEDHNVFGFFNAMEIARRALEE